MTLPTILLSLLCGFTFFLSSYYIGYWSASHGRLESPLTRTSLDPPFQQVPDGSIARDPRFDLVHSIGPNDVPGSSIGEVRLTANATASRSSEKGPVLAYLITGGVGDVPSMLRLVLSLYHPRNLYLLHLDAKASKAEVRELVHAVEGQAHMATVGNVHVAARRVRVTYRGPTMVAAYLQGASVLLQLRQDWDWFVNLSASDYPLMTQDDILFVLSNISRDTNFMEHTPNLEWKLDNRLKPIYLDPSLWDANSNGELQWVNFYRTGPSKFKPYTGSAWLMLSRPFVEYCVLGWDNFPRSLLMYFSNIVSSPEFYWQTLICNSEFKSTVLNSDLHLILWGYREQHPMNLNVSHLPKMIKKSVPFARKFKTDDPVLDEIDRLLLQRAKGEVTPGAWCQGRPEDKHGVCSTIGDTSVFRPGQGAQRFQSTINLLRNPEYLKRTQCRI